MCECICEFTGRFMYQKMNKQLKTKIFNYICLTRLAITSTVAAQVSVLPVPGKESEKCAKRKNVEKLFSWVVSHFPQSPASLKQQLPKFILSRSHRAPKSCGAHRQLPTLPNG